MSENAAGPLENNRTVVTFADLDAAILANIVSFVDELENRHSLSLVNQKLHNMVSEGDARVTEAIQVFNEVLTKLDETILPEKSESIRSRTQTQKVCRVSKTNAPGSEEEALLDLILKYKKHFLRLCKSPNALSLIAYRKNEVYDGLAPSARMATLFKCYLYAYTDEDTFAADPSEVLTPANQNYLKNLNKLPFFTKIETSAPGEIVPPPTEEEWKSVYENIQKKYKDSV